MKASVNIARVLVGALFVFSGLVKAIDPLGLAYKMQEFFEVWAAEGFMKDGMHWLTDHAVWLSVQMIALEVVLGVALLLGWKTKFVSWLLLLLTLFFTFLTAYVLFSGKIRECGCFGDCIPLTPVQTFIKDLLLLALIVFIIVKSKYIQPLFSTWVSVILILGSLFGVAFLQFYVLRHLPIKDCLPYRKGNDLLELRKMPADAIPDKYDYSFVYEKAREKKEFTASALPDSTWTFVDRKQVLIQKGKNNIPLINDFSLKTESGNDTTEAILGQAGEYYLLFIKDMDALPKKWVSDRHFMKQARLPVYIVASERERVKQRYQAFNPVIFICDGVAIKTAARSNPTVYKMKGPVVQGKWGWADISKVIDNK